MPIYFNPDDRIVVYPYFTDTLLDLVRADPDSPAAELKKVLRYVGEAIQNSMPKTGSISVWFPRPEIGIPNL